MTTALTPEQLRLLTPNLLDFTGTSTDKAVTITASYNGEQVAKVRTVSTGYAYLVVRFSPGGIFSNHKDPIPPRLTVVKRAKSRQAAQRAAYSSGTALLARTDDGGYEAIWRSIY